MAIYKPSLINLLQTLCFYLYVEEAHPNLPPRSVEAPKNAPFRPPRFRVLSRSSLPIALLRGQWSGKAPQPIYHYPWTWGIFLHRNS